MAERPTLCESAPSKGRLNVKRLAPYTLGTLDQEYSWEQLWKLEKHFKMEPYPDLVARRVLATRLKLTEEQVKTWFTRRSLKQEMRKSVCHNPYCASNKAGGCRPLSRQCRLIPINSSEQFRLDFQRHLKLMQSYQTHRRHLRQGVYKSRESIWCRVVLPCTVKPHISHAFYQGKVMSDKYHLPSWATSQNSKESSQNSPGLPETLEALEKLRLSSGYENTGDF